MGDDNRRQVPMAAATRAKKTSRTLSSAKVRDAPCAERRRSHGPLPSQAHSHWVFGSLQTSPSTCTVRSSAWEFVGSRTSQVDPSYLWISWSLQKNPTTSSGENSWAAEQVKLIDPINRFVSCQQVHGSGDLSAPLEAVGYYVHFVNPSTSQLNGWYYFRDP